MLVVQGTKVLVYMKPKSWCKEPKSNLIFEWVVHKDVEEDTCLLAVLIVITKRLKIPQQCANIIWSETTRTAGAFQGNLVLNPVDDDLMDVIWAESMDLNHCEICGSACLDALDIHDSFGGTTEYLNCTRCMLHLLCDECKLHLPNDAFDFSERDWKQKHWNKCDDHKWYTEGHTWPVCYYCLEERDVPFVRNLNPTDREQTRLWVLHKEFHDLLTDKDRVPRSRNG